MMALRILPLLQVIIILFTPSTMSYSYPIYGTKRYGRSSGHRITSNYDNPYQPIIRPQSYPNMDYYKLYPYAQSYTDDYFYTPTQENINYPMYYPRPSKYEVYQAVMPYYYPYGYGYNDQLSDFGEDYIQKVEREQRQENEPIGHEIIYENGNINDDGTYDDVNAAFLQNLIMSQVYQDSINNKNNDANSYMEYDYDDNTKLYEDNFKQKEDEDVKELKQLIPRKNITPQKYRNKQNNGNSNEIHWFQKSSYRNQKNENKRSSDNVVFADRKLSKFEETTTNIPEATTLKKNGQKLGQKEEVLMRPATPVRRPFSNSVLELMNTKNEVERKRTPSVYDTIKHMLEVEKSLEGSKKNDEIRPAMKKRLISSGDSLTRQLSLLKKVQQ